MVEIEVSLSKPKHQYHLSEWGECVYGAQSWNQWRLLCKSMFIPIERQTLILKMAEREVFLMEANHQYHLSQWGECVCFAQSWKERRLLCEPIFIPIESWTLILKKVERDVFLAKPNHQYHLS